MSEPKAVKTLEQIFQSSDDADTAAQIAEQLNHSATGNFPSDETAAAAKVIREELLKRLETTTDPNAQLAIARAARSHFRQIVAENTAKHCAEARKGWAPWRIEFDDWVKAGKPADKMPSARCFSATQSATSAAPEADEDGEI